MDDLKRWTLVSIRLIDETGLSTNETMDLIFSLDDFKHTSISSIELYTSVLSQLYIRKSYSTSKNKAALTYLQ